MVRDILNECTYKAEDIVLNNSDALKRLRIIIVNVILLNLIEPCSVKTLLTRKILKMKKEEWQYFTPGSR